MRLRRKAFSGGGFAFSQTISTQVTAYNLITEATAAGWDGVSPIIATIAITAAGSVVGGAGAGLAFDVPALPNGSLVTIVNDGYIAGGGGAGGAGGAYTGSATSGQQGGTALRTRMPLVLKGAGSIAGGGGGGGGGAGIYITSGTGSVSSNGGTGGPGARWPSTANAAGVTPGFVSSGDASCRGGTGGAGGSPVAAGDNGDFGVPAGSYVTVTNGAVGTRGAVGHAVDGMDYVLNESECNLVGSAAYTANSYIGTPASTPAAGAAFDGGYYVGGLMWEQTAQSDTSLLIGASKTITLQVPSLAGSPAFYANQLVELRSRSNPANYLRGNVQGAANGNLTLLIGSSGAGGSGTYSDWSLMCQYRIIVAPKATGETTLAMANGALPSGCWTLNEGMAATQAMIAAGDSTQYPAAHWSDGLSIGGYSDWYVPARDELDRIWRFLKPASISNYATADRPTGASSSYENNGAKGDVSASHGINNNAAAAGTAYTAGVPAQTGVTAFRTAGAQAMEYGTAIYGSSTGYDTATLWAQSYQTATPGKQVTQAKGTATLIRAVRKSII